MNKEEMQRKIEAKIDTLEEGLRYQLEAQCELLGGLETIRYLMHLTKNEDKAN